MLPKKNRLTARGDFKGVFSGSYRLRSGPYTLFCGKNNLSYIRFGFVVPLTVSKKATVRNKIRRRLHEIVRQLLPHLDVGYDCVIRVYPGGDRLLFDESRKTVLYLLQKAGVER